MRRILVTAGVFVAAWTGGPAAGPAVPVAATSRTVYASVVDNKGLSVSGLTAADFAVKEGGKDYPLTAVEPAKGPMQVVVVVDDNGTGAFRTAVFNFVKSMLARGEFEIVTVIGGVRRVTDFTNDGAALSTAISSLIQRPGAQDGAYLVDGVFEALKDLQKRKATRPVVVALSVNAADRSLARSNDVLRLLKETMATFHSVSLGNSMVSENSGGMDQVNANQVLDDGPKQAGGRRQSLVGLPELTDAVNRIVDQLSNQYMLTYSLPEGVKMNERLQVTVKRSGTTVLAPTKIADK